MRQNHGKHVVLSGLLAILVGLGIGCSKPEAAAPQATTQQASPTAPTDTQIASQVQGRLQADSGLSNLPIQSQVINGVVTLTGTVNNEAARELAANDAAQINGVRTVVNNLIVQQAAAAVPPGPSAADIRAKKKEDEARLRRQREQARKLREQQQAQQQAQNTAPPPPVVDVTPSQAQPTPPPPPPPPQPVTQTVTIPAGTDLSVRTADNLETGKTQPNDPFRATLVDSLVVNGLVAIPRGASVTGVVVDSKDAAHFKGSAMLSLQLQKIKTGGKTLMVATDPLVRQGKARGKNTAVKAGGGALLGTLIGAIAGGGKGAAIGAASGAGLGAGANAVTRGDQVVIPSETVLHFQLSQPLNVTVTTMPDGQPVPSSNGGNPQ